MLDRWCAWVAREVEPAAAAAMVYSLQAPGKRVRPALVVAAHRELGGGGDPTELAAAVEIVHTYSLVHDDLPCMDDDDLRRGRPTTHRRFDAPTATEAGFRLVSLSARALAAGAARLGLDGPTLGTIARELYRAGGVGGMIGGQLLDLEAEGRTVEPEALARIHVMKTGTLIAASAVSGALAAGAPSPAVAAMRKYGGDLGLAFQVVDDLLDATATSDQLGKTAGKDAAQQKASFAALLGVAGARGAARAHADRAIDHLRAAGLDCDLLVGLARWVVERTA